MNNDKKRSLFTTIIYVANIVVVAIGSTFAYFSVMVESETNAVSMEAAEFKLEIIEDVSLIKTQVIPSAERVVNLSLNRFDETGDFLHPYKSGGELVTDKTVCVDDNLNEICSVYTFTLINPMTEADLPVQITIIPSVHTFTNMKYKVVKKVTGEDGKLVIEDVNESNWLVDDRYERDLETGGYLKDRFGHKIKKENFAELTTSDIIIPNVDEVVPKAKDKNNPGKITLSIVLWVEEIHQDQTEQDSGQVFAGKIVVDSMNTTGNGITGVFTAGGVDNQ